MEGRTAKQVWQAALGELQLEVTPANFDTWLKDTVGLECQPHAFIIGVPSDFSIHWLKERFHSLIRRTLIGITGHDLEVRFQLHQPQVEEAALWPAVTQPHGSGEPQSNPSVEAAVPWKQNNHRSNSTRLNPKYTFDCFIVGSCNRLAHAAAWSVAKSPGRSYNPLFIYGGVGLGKTHLLHAIGHLSQRDDHSVIYVTSEQFTNEFINAIREGSTDDFRNKYRNVDVLLIDDIQFIAGKEQTQEGFFHTFNDLHNANSQIVLSSDRPPKSIRLLEDRLRSRFEWGLIADLQPPDLETRLAILRAKAEEQQAEVSQGVLEFIARRIQKNIRELEGSLNRVMAYARLTRTPLTPELAAQALADLPTTSPRKNFTPEVILDTVGGYFNLNREAMLSARRDKQVAWARQIAMYLMREEMERPLAEIGKEMGGRGHTTVLRACEKVVAEMNAKPELRRTVLEIREHLYSRPDLASP